jgi:hypothetical protein
MIARITDGVQMGETTLGIVMSAVAYCGDEKCMVN